MNRALQTIGVVILSFTFSFADSAPTVAIATVIGEAFLNGYAVTRSSAVLDGDLLTTGPSAALILHLPGSSIHIGSNSEARYHSTALDLISGSVEIQGRESIVAGAYTLSPDAEARFTVQHDRTQIALHLLRGSIKLSHGKAVTTLVTPGEYTFHDDVPTPSMKPRAITKSVPIGAGSAAGASVVISHWLTAKHSATSTSCVSGKSPDSCK